MSRATAFFVVFAFVVAFAASALSQGRLEYRYGNDDQSGHYGGVGDRDRASQIKDGWSSVWGGAADTGAISGNIGRSISPKEYSERQIALNQQRISRISSQIQELKSTPAAPEPQAYLKRVVRKRTLTGLANYAESRDPNDLYVQWKSTSIEVREQLAETYYLLSTVETKSDWEEQLRLLGLESVSLADESYSNGNKEDADFYFGFASAAADILVGLDPVTGTLRSISEAVTGVNLVAGEELDEFERGLAVFGVITLGYGNKFTKGAQAIGKLARRSALGEAAWNASLAYARGFQDGFRKFQAVGASAEDALQRYASVLREAAEGPRRRMKQLAAELGDDAAKRSPDLYKLDDPRVHLMPEKGMDRVVMTTEEADAIGAAFVGPDAVPFSDGSVGLRSKDARYQYRRQPKSSGEQQANLEIFSPDRPRPLSNFHIDIRD